MEKVNCSIMDLADDIAFAVHDLEDSLALRLITKEDFEYQNRTARHICLSRLKERYPDESRNDLYGSFVGISLATAGAEARDQSPCRLFC
ncbi:MAG: hypothetical protein E5W70_20255 [Mesorhizobium sp.]|uniref:hypothetical protein n=1 Tax=Mesorhizobium sp. TaxID=1871066 RepID=UPI0011F492D6|nr:hypothetical protein [Mesorhizobium sp.]TIT20683.1 MAG: hypothetical protein E5W70_20255 [Mesorhizobium sp.]